MFNKLYVIPLDFLWWLWVFWSALCWVDSNMTFFWGYSWGAQVVLPTSFFCSFSFHFFAHPHFLLIFIFPRPLFSFCDRGQTVSLESAHTFHGLLFSQVSGVMPSCSPSSAAFVPPQVELWVPTCYFLKMHPPAPGQGPPQRLSQWTHFKVTTFLLPED